MHARDSLIVRDLAISAAGWGVHVLSTLFRVQNVKVIKMTISEPNEMHSNASSKKSKDTIGKMMLDKMQQTFTFQK